jgi:hypothetical protein
MQAPMPRSAYEDDTFVVPGPTLRRRSPTDVRDLATATGKITPAQMDPGSRARICWKSRRVCVLRCSSTEGSTSR